MRLIKTAGVVGIVCFLSACRPGSDVPATQTPRAALSGTESVSTAPVFQVVTAQNGKLFRLNTQTGQMHLITDDGLVELTDKIGVLRVGEYYQMADATTDERFLKYLGNGAFEKDKFAIRKK